jgi:formate dehydrogenase maturation protein FdhE
MLLPTVGNLRERAEQLKEKWPGYRSLLEFYVAVREAQQKAKPRIRLALEMPTQLPRLGGAVFPIDVKSSSSLFAALCRIGRAANPHFAAGVERIERALAGGGPRLETLLNGAQGEGFIEQAAAEGGLDARVLSFLLENSIRPSIEAARDQLLAGFEQDSWRKRSCPVCGAPPTLSVLKGQPALRHSICSRCGCQWRVDRVSCSVCGNRDPEALQYFHGEGQTAHRIDSCDACHHYIKTIDIGGFAAPDLCMEDLGTLHLDIVAAEKGYLRVVPNPWTA